MPNEAGPESIQKDFLTRLITQSLFLALAAGIAAAVFSMALENQYRATATLLLAPPPIASVRDELLAAANAKPQDNPVPAVTLLMAKPLSVPDYQLMLMSDDVVSALRETLVAEFSKLGRDLSGIPLEDVRKAMEVKTRILKQTAYDVVYQPLVQLNFTSTSPEVASAAANRWAELGVEKARELATKGQEGSLEFLEEQHAEAKTKLEEAEAELETLDSEWELTNLRERLASLEKELTLLDIERARLATKIARSQGEAGQLQKDRDATEPVITLRKAPPDEAYWLMKNQGSSPSSGQALETEQINEVYTDIRKRLSLAESTLEGQIAEKSALDESAQRMAGEIAELRKLLAQRTRVRGEVQRRVETLSAQYKQLAASLESARIAKAQQSSDLKIASAAAVPETKVGPHRSIIVLAAAFLGALILPMRQLVRFSLGTYSALLASAGEKQTGS